MKSNLNQTRFMVVGILASLASGGLGCSKKAGDAASSATELKSMTPGLPQSVTSAGVGGGPRASVPAGAGSPTRGVRVDGTTAPSIQDLAKAEKPAEPPKPEVGCYTYEFQHKAIESHRSEDACSHHKNLIQIKHEKLVAGSLCVRVDGTPVAYTLPKDKPGYILIGAVAGPQSKIRVRYCVGKALCQENCSIPKDEFLDALGAADDGKGGVAHWDSEDGGKDADPTAEIDPEVKRELARLDADEAEKRATGIFGEWIGNEGASACAGKRKI